MEQEEGGGIRPRCLKAMRVYTMQSQNDIIQMGAIRTDLHCRIGLYIVMTGYPGSY